MSIAHVLEISSTSSQSFQDAIDQALSRAHETLSNVQAEWINEQRRELFVEGAIPSYRVDLLVTFVERGGAGQG